MCVYTAYGSQSTIKTGKDIKCGVKLKLLFALIQIADKL